MMRTFIIGFIAICCLILNFLAIGAPAQPSKTAICEKYVLDKKIELRISYDEFNKGETDKSWKKVAREGCYHQAAEFIDYYLLAHPYLSQWRRTKLLYHAGQMWAAANNKSKAIMNFNQAIMKGDSSAFAKSWNIFMQANIAFLTGNKNELEHYHLQILSFKPTGANMTEIRVINVLLKHFGKPYADIYKLIENEKV